MIVVSTALFLLLILLIIFAIRHWLISLPKALKHFNLMKDYLEFTFFKFPNMVLELSYSVQFSLTWLSHYLWGIFLTLFHLFLSFLFE